MPHDSRPELPAHDGANDPPAPRETLVFLCGADMNPSLIMGSSGLEGARFIAIARADGAVVAGWAGLPAALADQEIWGIAVRVSEATLAATPNRRDTVAITLGNGDPVDAEVKTTQATVGTIAEVLAQAHYWELPVSYRARLQRLLER